MLQLPLLSQKLKNKHEDLIYEVNYGYVPGVIGGDGEEQDAYILGVNKPIKEFDGELIAKIIRNDDNETKWVVAPENMHFSDEEMLSSIYFQKRYFDIDIVKKQKGDNQ